MKTINKNKHGKDERAVFEEGKLQCEICKGWYKHLGSHVAQRHRIPARKYKELFGLDVSKGIVIETIKEKMRKSCIRNKNGARLMESGVSTRYKKGDKRAGDYKRSEETLTRLRGYGLRMEKQKKNLQKS